MQRFCRQFLDLHISLGDFLFSGPEKPEFFKHLYWSTRGQKVVEKERKRKYRVSRTDRFRYRSRYFTDSGIIGSKAFVGEVFNRVKHLMGSKDSPG